MLTYGGAGIELGNFGEAGVIFFFFVCLHSNYAIAPTLFFFFNIETESEKIGRQER